MMTREEAKTQLEKIYWDHKQSNQLGSALTTLTYAPGEDWKATTLATLEKALITSREKTDQLATLIKQLGTP